MQPKPTQQQELGLKLDPPQGQRPGQIMHGRRGLIVGIANERSLAYGIAQEARAHGARLIVTYQNERLRPKVEELAQGLGAEAVLPCDLTDPGALTAVREAVALRFGALDFAVHGVAFALREELDGRFVDTSREGFLTAMEVSVFTLVAMVREIEPLLRAGTDPAVLTLTHYGSEKAIPNYNVMGVAKAALEASVRYLAQDLGPHGIRVNALSAGAIKTLSAAGIKGLRRMLGQAAEVSPLRRNITLSEVGRASLLALSNLGSAMTGEVFHIDCGYHAVGAAPSGESSP